jgi:hypothetical protein
LAIRHNYPGFPHGAGSSIKAGIRITAPAPTQRRPVGALGDLLINLVEMAARKRQTADRSLQQPLRFAPRPFSEDLERTAAAE